MAEQGPRGNSTDLTGRTALVTGGGSGIGAACARVLARNGAHVVVIDRDADGAADLAAEIGGESLALDLGDLDALAAQRFDADILVNNAGIQTVAPIVEFDPATFRRPNPPRRRRRLPSPRPRMPRRSSPPRRTRSRRRGP
ncbi:Ribitol 2-dehydrogenase [Microbacterium azadirachtae]|uniref:Ribitol 2-dehydrogenase n=1 Tax=Microbacterium azadirachtae TaxID=582680 RepID=A0A0F0KM64_9MICO|nr:Ribitol 2-dehydrogenase [Microbacterium azadirachtae]